MSQLPQKSALNDQKLRGKNNIGGVTEFPEAGKLRFKTRTAASRVLSPFWGFRRLVRTAISYRCWPLPNL
jgi:hypothetical protein